jgi:protein xylosyltransferase
MLILILAGTSRFSGHSEAFYRIFSLGSPEFGSRSTVVLKGPGRPPVLAYLISGTHGDGEWMKRLLNFVYHPRNQYLLHLDRQALDGERVKLALYAKSNRVFRVMDNVNVMGKADAVTYMGSTAIASTLHAAAILLRVGTNWDWLITLSALDYPLITQDGRFLNNFFRPSSFL